MQNIGNCRFAWCDLQGFSVQFQLVVNGNPLFFSGMLLLTRTTLVLKILADLFSVVMLLYFVWDDGLESHTKGLSDLYTSIISFVFGLHLMVMAANLLSIYLSIEMVSPSLPT